MEDRTVSVQVYLSAEDYCTIQNKSTLRLRIIFSVIFPFIILNILGRTGMPTSAIYFGSGMMLIIWVVTMLFIAPKIMKDTWIRQYNNYKIIQKEQLFVISLEGLECSSETGVSRYAWNDLYALKETDEAFYIYVSMNQFFYITKRSFDIDDEEVLFVRKCFSNLTDYRKKLKKDKPLASLQKNIGIVTVIICAFILLIGFILFLFMLLSR